MNELARIVEALLFLSADPLPVSDLADACEVSEGEVVEALARLREHYAEGFRGVVLREVAGGFTLATDPVAEHAARRLLARPRTPPLTQAQAPEINAFVIASTPMKRAGKPIEVANGCLFLASDESSFVNGTRLFVDNGFTAA